MEKPNHIAVAPGTLPKDSRRLARVVYLVYREGLGPVFESMVVEPVSKLAAMGVDIRLAVFCQLGDFIRRRQRQRWRRVIQNVRQAFHGPFHRLPSPPARAPKFWDESTVLRRWFDRHYRDRTENVVVHCRGPQAASLAVSLRSECGPRIKVLFDMRGVQHMEHLYEHGLLDWTGASEIVQAEAQQLFDAERHAAQEADAIVCVSNAMKQFAVQSYRVPAEKIAVVWNHLDPAKYRADRIVARQLLGFSDRFVVVYCGSMYSWQLPHVGMRLFKLIKKIQPTAHYLMVTTDTQAIESVARQNGVDPGDLTVVGGDHAQVPRYLAAADLALITRGIQTPACVANRASSPVKFAEYLASGTPVVMSDGIGDYSELAQRHDVGLVIPHDASDDWIEGKLRALLQGDAESVESLRARCRRLAIDELGSARQLERVTKLYSELSGVR